MPSGNINPHSGSGPQWNRTHPSDKLLTQKKIGATANTIKNNQEELKIFNKKIEQLFGKEAQEAIIKAEPSIKKKIKDFIDKREYLENKSKKLNIKDSIGAKIAHQVSLGLTKRLSESFYKNPKLKKYIKKARNIDREGQDLAYQIHQINHKKNQEYTPLEKIQLSVSFLKNKKHKAAKSIITKIEDNQDHLLNQNDPSLILTIFSQKEIRYLISHRIIKNQENQWHWEYPEFKKSAFLKNIERLTKNKINLTQRSIKKYEATKFKNIKSLYAEGYKDVLSEKISAHKRLLKAYSIQPQAGKKTIRQSMATIALPKSLLKAGLSTFKKAEKIISAAGLLGNAASTISMVTGATSVGLGAVSAGLNGLSTGVDIAEIVESKKKKKIANHYFQKYQYSNDPNHKELAAIAKLVKNRHSYRDDIIAALVHSNKALLAAGSVIAGSFLLGISAAGSAASMGIALPVTMASFAGASLGITIAYCSYKLVNFTYREIKKGRWLSPYENLQTIHLAQQKLTQIRSEDTYFKEQIPTSKLKKNIQKLSQAYLSENQATKIETFINNTKNSFKKKVSSDENVYSYIDPSIYKNDKKYKSKLEESTTYLKYIEKNQDTIKDTILLKDEALLHALIIDSKNKLEKGSRWDTVMHRSQQMPLVGRGIQYIWSGSHFKQQNKKWTQAIEETLAIVAINNLEILAINDSNSKLQLNDYERGAFRMHPSYNACMAESTLNPVKNDDQSQFQDTEIQAFSIFIHRHKNNILEKELEKELRQIKTPKIDKNISSEITTLFMNHSLENKQKFEDWIQKENNISQKDKDIINYEAIYTNTLKKARNELSKSLEKTNFGSKILRDLDNQNKATNQTAYPSYFSLEKITQENLSTYAYKRQALEESLHLYTIRNSGTYAIQALIKNLRKEEDAPSSLNNNNERPFRDFLKDLGLKNKDIQAILDSNNDIVSELLLRDLILKGN